ncbi:hypothetical protein OSB04_018603 [Centaurea solstitialis]|uniref:Neprosin PEP catalytic domain-containing protein n=1 Tax=Centaurea solstitialis TaxID=347529 RepID=A0AA38TQ23_9ASTR|nr:hypothetical protein OSB04_018603 [Centaurea solstitialis]
MIILPVFSIRQNNQVSSESEKMKLIRTHLKKINKPFVKSIKSPDGDIIDCVPFHLQPAFDLPELKSRVLLYAIGYARGEYYGLNATLNVWAPKVAANGFSLSQIWLAADVSSEDLNTIEAGWQVYPSLYGNDAPRLFIFWTSENYKNGCYNLLCSGFVQTNNRVALGAAIQPISTYNGPQYDIKLLIWKDPKTNDWWLDFENNLVGYWPSTLFTGLQEHAEFVEFGGEVVHSEISDSHPPTQMGSGHFAGEGFGKASFIKNLEVVDGLNKINRVSDMTLQIDKPNCYDITGGSNDDWGTYIYFGGPGNNCQN